MPVFAAIPAVLGSIGAAAGITGAGVAAGTSIAAGAAITGAAIAGGIGIASSVSAAAQAKKTEAAINASQNVQPNSSQTVGSKSTTTNTDQLGRAALIATSPSGVIGTDPTGRRQLLGAD